MSNIFRFRKFVYFFKLDFTAKIGTKFIIGLIFYFRLNYLFHFNYKVFMGDKSDEKVVK